MTHRDDPERGSGLRLPGNWSLVRGSIQDALQATMKDRTSFVVAQRISTVLNADKIIVIDQGRIAAEGTHAELMKSSSIYQEIYASQLGNGILDDKPGLPVTEGASRHV